MVEGRRGTPPLLSPAFLLPEIRLLYRMARKAPLLEKFGVGSLTLPIAILTRWMRQAGGWQQDGKWQRLLVMGHWSTAGEGQAAGIRMLRGK